jgi:hypothetical protein
MECATRQKTVFKVNMNHDWENAARSSALNVQVLRSIPLIKRRNYVRMSNAIPEADSNPARVAQALARRHQHDFRLAGRPQ